jgi:hypothetical protein
VADVLDVALVEETRAIELILGRAIEEKKPITVCSVIDYE